MGILDTMVGEDFESSGRSVPPSSVLHADSARLWHPGRQLSWKKGQLTFTFVHRLPGMSSVSGEMGKMKDGWVQPQKVSLLDEKI